MKGTFFQLNQYIDNRNYRRKKIYIGGKCVYFGGKKMNGCFDFLGNNCCLWVLIILLIILLAKNGCLNGIFNSCYCLPIALLLICYCVKGGSGMGNLFGGGCCK